MKKENEEQNIKQELKRKNRFVMYQNTIDINCDKVLKRNKSVVKSKSKTIDEYKTKPIS